MRLSRRYQPRKDPEPRMSRSAPGRTCLSARVPAGPSDFIRFWKQQTRQNKAEAEINPNGIYVYSPSDVTNEVKGVESS
ncbi:hypothetical protein NDU88_002471 [Pleurodeles waltl]|uniref:Uncharacterized protein n=1 Tax=Pleurodeles waltl TaxID=8319 RepID=A0AAV7WRS2_PLEWA|nr:hypothetical protein NDU88_002471 [Pleurodeles waltl]